MSTRTPQRQERTDTQTEFIALTEPMGLGPKQLAECAQSEQAHEGTRMYAVARIDGVIDYGPGELEEAEGCLVLYLSADGTHAAERRYWVKAGEFNEVDVAFNAEADAITPADSNARRFVPVLDAHDIDDVEDAVTGGTA